jgi:hypothetical protein
VRDYIRQRRQDDYVNTVSRKLWAYAVSRSPILPDDVLLQEMRARLVSDRYRFSSLVETIVTSAPFLNRRADAPNTQMKAE